MKEANGIQIFENLKEIVDPSHTCLVVWDVQNGLVDRIFNKGEFMAALKPFIEALRGRVPVFYTLITPLPKPYLSSWLLYSMMRRFGVDDASKLPAFMAPGSPERLVPEPVQPLPNDMVIEKSTANIFLGTNFEFMLRNRNIKTIVFTGIATEIGVESSARDAANRGFYPLVVSDCVSSRDRDAHDRSLKNMAGLLLVANSAEVLDAIAD
jgi:nicotinamidase-related amidase